MLDLDTVIDYLQECRRDFGNITVVLTADDLQEPGDFIALDQIPGLVADAG